MRSGVMQYSISGVNLKTEELHRGNMRIAKKRETTLGSYLLSYLIMNKNNNENEVVNNKNNENNEVVV